MSMLLVRDTRSPLSSRPLSCVPNLSSRLVLLLLTAFCLSAVPRSTPCSWQFMVASQIGGGGGSGRDKTLDIRLVIGWASGYWLASPRTY
ncbi:uncharacterized protein F4822DRAFT_407488 [Hypoxylon trugodes]|uniref:uncharacterized protein n=1 Tax=Hypoxylon trugodes TaxID=326681 RepID=UPI002197E296|nr:uncharacterized protein F4822DRAFT_407488 [Hypoxylon trugodes]KAI1387752.1 hypothetical protein F4822DRAFT_407488 [Hypoxylon trugodes]